MSFYYLDLTHRNKKEHKAVNGNPASVFEELRPCSKLRGLILAVPDDLQLEAIGPLSQQLEFIAFPGTKLSRAWSAFRFILAGSKNSVEDLWIEVRNSKEVRKIIRALRPLEGLKNVVLVLNTSVKGSRDLQPEHECFVETLEECFDSAGGGLKQATLLYELEPGHRTVCLTYSLERQKKTNFSSAFITRFYSEWLKYIP
ncbi:unnamed protein product, partial [Notodromas monacha]